MEKAAPPVSHQQQTNILKLLDILGKIQKLTLKAFQSYDQSELIPLILQGTKIAINYDRAILFQKIGDEDYEAIGDEKEEIASSDTSSVKNLVNSINDLSKPIILSDTSFADEGAMWREYQKENSSMAYWAPILQGKDKLGLWIEKYNDPAAAKEFETFTPLLKEFLLPAFASAWQNIPSHSLFMQILHKINLKKWLIIFSTLLFLLLLIPVHLRIVAPCEVVAQNPYLITAPIDGIIKTIYVEPAQKVQEGQILLNFDDRTFKAHYQAALENVEQLKTEVSRAYVLGMKDDAEMAHLAELTQKLEKGKVELDFTKQQLDLTIMKAPISGLVTMDNPETWRGKPVHIGEKIMTISNPEKTKLRIWIPEKDLVTFSPEQTIQVFLNANPEKTFTAKLLYISNQSKMIEERLAYFEAEAEWVDVEDPPKLGLYGSAALYGERVSLFYYLVRKPLSVTRKWIGI